jgi:hypothetical protein
MTGPDNEEAGDAIKAAWHKFNGQVDTRRKARKQRRKQALKASDRRSLRATGRTEQLNIKAAPRIKALLAAHVENGGLSLWIEEAILAKLRAEGVDVDA